jgi:7-keto-8-aminopelargonate synthetase-like enzyme
VQIGTLSKAVGVLGGFVCGTKYLREFLINTSRPFIYTTALPPAVLQGCISSLNLIKSKEGELLRKKLFENFTYIRCKLKDMGFKLIGDDTHIVPLLIGNEKKALYFSRKLLENGIYAPCIRYPSVPHKKSRIRFNIMATHTKKHLDFCINMIYKISNELKFLKK